MSVVCVCCVCVCVCVWLCVCVTFWIPRNMSELLKASVLEFHHGAAELNPARNHEVEGSITGLTQWVKDLTLP